MEWVVILLGVLGLGLGLGLALLRFVPKMVEKIVSLVATVTLAIMFWNLVGLPAVEMLNLLTETAWMWALSLGYLVGDRFGNLF